MSIKYVRIKKRDPRRGHFLQKYMYKGAKFETKKGWYKVSDEVADYLATIHQRTEDRLSPFAFDICTEEEAKRMDSVEQQEKEPKRPADNAREVQTREEKKTAPTGKRGRPTRSPGPESSSSSMTQTPVEKA